MLGLGLNLVTVAIGFGMSTTFIVFVCGRLLCGRVRSTESRGNPFDLELHSDADQSEHTISGLGPVAVAAIPTVKYKKPKTEDYSQEDAQCSICLAEYEEKEVLRIMPNCNHRFHLVCIDIWLLKEITCPICRLPLNTSSIESKHATISLEHRMELNHEARDRPESYREIDESVYVEIEQPERIRGGS